MDERIYVNASQPARLLDGATLTNCPTLQEAVIAWQRLPSERRRTATISTASRVFAAQEIDRLYYGPEPEGASPHGTSFGTAGDQIAALAPKLSNAAVLSTMGETGPIPPQAGAAPQELKTRVSFDAGGPIESTASLGARSGARASGWAVPSASKDAATTLKETEPTQQELRAEGILVGGGGTIAGNLAANLAENRRAAQALLTATQAKLAELRDTRSNDVDLIDFLEWLAKGLSALVENLDRAIAEPASEPIFLGKAGEIVHKLQLGLMEAVDKNRVKIWEYGAGVGTICFLYWLGGENLARVLSTVFGRK